MKPQPGSVLFGVSVTVVLASVGAGLFLLGSPKEERVRRMDDRRVADLQGIAVSTDLYWTRHSRLPASLEDLSAEPGVSISTGDPVSAEPYGYHPMDDARYEVCASFERESVVTSREAAITSPIVQESCQLCPLRGSVGATQVGVPIAAHIQLRNLWTHDSGRQCFQLEAEGIPRNSTMRQ